MKIHQNYYHSKKKKIHAYHNFPAFGVGSWVAGFASLYILNDRAGAFLPMCQPPHPCLILYSPRLNPQYIPLHRNYFYGGGNQL